MTTGTNEGYYIHTDQLGSVIALSDQAGNIAEEYTYNAWGKRRDPNDWSKFDNRTSFITDRGFTGHEHLDAVSLINMNGRVYDPNEGLFLSPDPLLQAPGNALNYNRYSYCFNNPLKYIDPSGYWSAEQGYGGNNEGWDQPIHGGQLWSRRGHVVWRK